MKGDKRCEHSELSTSRKPFCKRTYVVVLASCTHVNHLDSDRLAATVERDTVVTLELRALLDGCDHVIVSRRWVTACGRIQLISGVVRGFELFNNSSGT